VTSSGASLGNAAAICGYALCAGLLLYLTCSRGLKRVHRFRTTAAATQASPHSPPAWAYGGALTGCILAAVAATAVVAMHEFGTSREVGATVPGPSAVAGGVSGSWYLPRPPTRRAVVQTRGRVPKEVTRATKGQAATVSPASARKTTFVANTVQTASTDTAPAAAEAPNSRGPTPLQAPKLRPPRAPLKAP
jgi:hypothetical protein